jgi:hypothetical protein
MKLSVHHHNFLQLKIILRNRKIHKFKKLPSFTEIAFKTRLYKNMIFPFELPLGIDLTKTEREPAALKPVVQLTWLLETLFTIQGADPIVTIMPSEKIKIK